MPVPLHYLKRSAAALIAVVVVSLTAGRAEARCGHPVFPIDAYTLPVAVDGHDDSPWHPPTLPCHGPNCSSSPAPLPVPNSLPTTFKLHFKDWAQAAVIGIDMSNPRFSGVIPSGLGRPVHRTVRLLDPPRFA